MAYKDPLDERARVARRKHYQNNKQQYIDRKNLLKGQMRKVLDDVKSQPCMDCGESYPPYVMDLDHRNPSEKIGCVAKIVTGGSMKALLLEIEKCDVVCSNCHRERTHKQVPLV